MTVAYLSTTADALLAAALAGLAQATTGVAPPSHVFVAHGQPAWDFPCEGGQLTVHVETVAHVPTDDSPLRQSCQIVPKPVWVITLIRCVRGLRPNPTDPFPAETDIDEDSGLLLIDLWAILTELYDRIAANTLIPGNVTACDYTIGDAIPVGPEGAAAGWEIRVTTVANDQGPTGS